MHQDNVHQDLVRIAKDLYPHGHPDFTNITINELKLHSEKNGDYAGGGNPLGNFLRVSSFFSLYPNLKLDNPVVVAIMYLAKQLDACLWLMNTGRKGNVEGVSDRLGDISVYAKLARIIYEDQRKQESGVQAS